MLVRELKAILADWPDEYPDTGEPTEVLIVDGSFMQCSFEVDDHGPMDKRIDPDTGKWGADLFIEFYGRH